MATLNSGSTGSSVNTHSAASSGKKNPYQMAFILITVLFFVFGFITCLNDILVPHLKSLFTLNYTQAALIQFCFFTAYFFASLPSGKIVTKMGYKKGTILGVIITAIGCLLFYPAAGYQSYAFFLVGLFVLASGITLIQVAVNPYVAILGPPETASARLNLAQAFNSLGTTIAPMFGSYLILSAVMRKLTRNSVRWTRLLSWRSRLPKLPRSRVLISDWPSPWSRSLSSWLSLICLRFLERRAMPRAARRT